MKIIVLMFSLLFSSLSFASTINPADSLLDTLGSFQTLSAHFDQAITDADGRLLQTSEGDVLIKRPGKFYWYVKTPLEQKITVNDQLVTIYDIDLEQVTKHAIDKTKSQLPALLLSTDNQSIISEFSVTEPQSQQYLLVPKAKDGLIDTLTLTFHSDLIQSVVMKDHLDQTTTITFSNVKRNPPIRDGAFTLSYPKEVDVLGNE